MDQKRTRAIARYSGHVQGVGFRMTAISVAKGLRIDGFVCNQSDGTVLMDVEGSPSDVKKLLSRIEAVMAAKIDAVDVRNHPPDGACGGFRISG